MIVYVHDIIDAIVLYCTVAEHTKSYVHVRSYN